MIARKVRSSVPAARGLALALAALGIASTYGCAADVDGDEARDGMEHVETAQGETSRETRAALTTDDGAPVTRLSPVGDEGYDFPQLRRPLPWDPPKGWDIPPMPEDEGRGMPRFGCVSNCCSVHYVKVFDPARNAPITVPVTVCN